MEFTGIRPAYVHEASHKSQWRQKRSQNLCEVDPGIVIGLDGSMLLNISNGENSSANVFHEDLLRT